MGVSSLIAHVVGYPIFYFEPRGHDVPKRHSVSS
ncbi:hypothetical protein PS928_06599 [Pseudomonas fluorescens]|uniref:Uncharacterized protein n=1 Tax=Pseudomonas fluorescens TaxID=294 RepID=A0A5E7VVE1_PSEFL|nr:hypothetical protein PS928_06599 [Pseudomonas fluorescens]